ncbi:MAG: ComEC/Rec2 family competence protein, partial [Clostridia bacterium]|nr:ComEC/Rec2 family competence protein [Clostridia bacterium]
MKRYLNFRPILYFAISLILGILSAYLYFSKAFIILSILIVLFLICLILFLIMARGKIKSKLIYLLVFVLFSIIGTCSCTLSIIDYDKADLGKVNLTVNGRITEVYQTESSKAYFLSEVKFSGIKNVKSNYKLCVYVYGATDYDVGDIISFYATVNDLGVIYEGKINTQNIASKYKYNCTVNSDKITLLGNNTTIFEKVNLGIRKALQEGLDSREFSVAYALMCGNSEYMDEELIFSFRQAGVAHIFAVSGLHIGFMATSISFLLRKFKVNKIISAIITILLLIFYSGVCGFSISS